MHMSLTVSGVITKMFYMSPQEVIADIYVLYMFTESFVGLINTVIKHLLKDHEFKPGSSWLILRFQKSKHIKQNDKFNLK